MNSYLIQCSQPLLLGHGTRSPRNGSSSGDGSSSGGSSSSGGGGSSAEEEVEEEEAGQRVVAGRASQGRRPAGRAAPMPAPPALNITATKQRAGRPSGQAEVGRPHHSYAARNVAFLTPPPLPSGHVLMPGRTRSIMR